MVQGTGKFIPKKMLSFVKFKASAKGQWIVWLSLVLMESGPRRRSVCEDDSVSKQGWRKLQTLILFAPKLLTFLWARWQLFIGKSFTMLRANVSNV